VASPKSVRAARCRTSGDPRKSAISGKRRSFSATTSLPICQAFWPDSAPFSPAPRLQHLARQIHGLGERPLYELFRELERGADLHDTLERYARLSPLAEFIAALGGDRFAKPRVLSAKAKPKQRAGREVAEASWAAP
jgi:hypothetical protein